MSVLKYCVICLFFLSGLCHAKQNDFSIPSSDETSRVLTLNNKGWMHPFIDDITQEFINFSGQNKDANLLEIGAAYGYISEIVLKQGAKIWVNDLDKRHLEIFKNNIEDKTLLPRLTLLPGDFPDEIKLEENSFDAILAVRVLHFFEPDKLERATKAMYKALKKGGRVYVVADTPYLKNLAKYISLYEEKRRNNHPYPGYITNIKDDNTIISKYLPLHFLDPDVLTRVFIKAGFKVEKAVFLERKDYPKNMQLDGRESVGLIAIKE